MLELRSAKPEVRLVGTFVRPFDGAVAAARTCYSAKGIVTAEDVGGDALPDAARADALARRDRLAREIYQAGHHTVYQHAHFEFAIDRVSRHALWSFFHAHPFYNSEQVSQRYVKVRRNAALAPKLTDDAAAIYDEILELQERAYHRLTEMLEPVVSSSYFAVFPARGRRPEKWKREVRRKAQEAARYVLPVATWARLYHTVSALTLLRYRRACLLVDVPDEVRFVVDEMIDAVLAVDPGYEKVLEQPLAPDGMAEDRALADVGGTLDSARAEAFCSEFDRGLDGRVSRLSAFSPDAERVVARAVRQVLGLPECALDDGRAIRLAADPAENPVYAEALNLTTMTRLARALHHAHYTFERRLSHTADSQDQRHRMTPASRPILAAHLRDAPDVVYPMPVVADEACRRLFDETMERIWDGLRRLRQLGAGEKTLVYLLPNASAVRFTESADFLALRHKHAMRLCFNAQEEIWRASLDESRQVRDVHPILGAFLQPPCSHRSRAGRKPPCPEGSRYCGVPVWRMADRDWKRTI